MDFVTGLPAAGKENYNCCLVIVDRFSKRVRLLPCFKESTAVDIAFLFWERLITDTGIPRIIISDRDPKFTSNFWASLYKLMGKTLALSTAYHPQTDGLAERMIQTLEDMIRRYCAFGLEFKDKDGYTHDWETLIPALELAYNCSIHSTTNKTPFELERGYNPQLPKDKLNLKNVEIHPTSLSFANMIKSAGNYGAQCVEESVKYNKERWDKTHKEPEFEIGEEVLISTTNFNGIQGPKKLKDSFIGPFVITKLHGKNAVEVELTKEFEKKHPVFPVSLIKKYSNPNKEKFRNRPIEEKEVPIEKEKEQEMIKILKEKRTNVGGKDTLMYLVRYKNRGADGDEWLPAKEIPESTTILRRFRANKRAHANI